MARLEPRRSRCPIVAEEAGPVRAEGREGAAQGDQAIKHVGVYHKAFRLPSHTLAGLMILTSEPMEAEQLLSEAFATGHGSSCPGKTR